MSVINTAPLNTTALGSAASNAARVNFQGTIVESVTGTLTVRPLIAPFKITRPLLCRGYIGAVPYRTAAAGSMFLGVRNVGTVSPTMHIRFHAQLRPSLVLSTTFRPRALLKQHMHLSQVMGLNMGGSGLSLSINAAPAERQLFVPNLDRTSYVARA